jgi:hypothetical protein
MLECHAMLSCHEYGHWGNDDDKDGYIGKDIATCSKASATNATRTARKKTLMPKWIKSGLIALAVLCHNYHRWRSQKRWCQCWYPSVDDKD